MSTFLFESKNLTVQSRKSFHEVATLNRISQWCIAGIFLVMLFLLLSPWAQTSRGQGRLIAYKPDERVQRIEATMDGRVLYWHVGEGQELKVGDPIVAISDMDSSILERLKAEKQSQIVRLKQAEQIASTSLINNERQKLLFDQGLSSRRTYELSRIELAKAQSDVANAKAELARIGVRLSRQESQNIRATRNGYIVRIHAGQGGEMVKTGDLLASFMPEVAERVVEVFVSGNDAPLIRSGQQARIQFEGWPAIQVSGWPSVAIGAFGGEVFFVDLVNNEKGEYRVLIRPKAREDWPSSTYLRQGGRAIAWILMNQVTVAYELWRIFNGFQVLPAAIENEAVVKAAKAKR